jgi:hypothetical protein
MCFIILILRRVVVGGELGGPPMSKNISAFICVFLWFIYIFLSTLQAYKVIEFDIEL